MKKVMYTALAASMAITTTGRYIPVLAKGTPNVSLSQLDITIAIQKIKDNYRLYVAGDTEMNANNALSSKIKAINTNANAAFQAYQGNKDAEELFKGVSIRKADTQDKDNSDNFKITAQKIYEMSLGYATSGTQAYQNSEYAKTILDALDKFYAVYSLSMKYNPEGLLYGNWWNWEIGVPTQLSNTFALMEKEIVAHNPTLLKQYVACFDNNLRNGSNGDVNLNAAQHTGTNLADITMNRILQGAVIGDTDRIKKAASDMMTVFDTIDPYNIKNGNTDGIYADGSFIQHHRVAYTGSYGKLLLQRAIQSLIILNDTPWQPQGQLTTLQTWIYKSFAPLAYEGYMMDMVKGRAVSRTATGYQDTVGVIESMVLLSQRLSGNEKAKMQSQLKYMAQAMPTKLNPASLTLSAVVPYEQIMNDDSIVPISQLQKGAYAFNSMDKNVQIGNGFAFALARSSNRIAKYEYMSGENLKPWFQGDGAFQLYLSGRDQSKAYGVNYNATIDPYRLPGTTVPQEERKMIPELYGQAYYPGYPAGSVEQNDYVYFPVGTNTISGSTTLDGSSAAILQLGDDNAYAAKQKGLLPNDFVAYKNANANKSWFMFDDKVIAMGSDIHDEKGRNVTSTIDNQMSAPDDDLKTTAMDINGKKITLQNGTFKDLKWINYNSDGKANIGYYFPENKPVTVKTDTRSGNLQDIRTANPNKIISEKFFTLTYEHGTKNNESYSYVMLPNADEKQTEAYANNPDIRILENSNTVHAVEDKSSHMKGYNFFTKGVSNGIETSAPVTILMKQEGKKVSIAISDPTFMQDEINLTLHLKNGELTSSNKRISAVCGSDTIQVKADTTKLYGQTLNMTFTLHDEPQKTPDNEQDKPSSGTQTGSDTNNGQSQGKPANDTNTLTENTSTSPTTGDTTKPLLYAGMFSVALAMMAFIRKRMQMKK